MKCHYEILGLERDATESDIKKSYRKLALQWHPDKNPDRLDECTKTFHLIQQAYEVLIDPQERAWYDKHREAILRGGLGRGGDYEDNSLDVFEYFSASCYSGFNDEEKGFYTVYRRVFETIASEDHEYMDNADSDFDIPGFGDSLSTYEEVVGQFYGYWESYCTAKSYVWAEKYDTREAPNRQVRRAMEQENKKLRDKAKKERNEQVRALVAFVKKRDKRVHAYKKKLEERAAEIARITEEKKLQQKQERLKKFENFRESGWSATHGLEKDLEALEADLSKQFGDEEYSSEEEEEQEESREEEEGGRKGGEVEADEDMVYDDLYCVACNRAFKTEKAFANHENSKKHKENAAILKAEMIEEDMDALSLEEEDLDEHILYDDLICVACDKAFDTEHALSSHEKSKKHRDTVARLSQTYTEEQGEATGDSGVPELHTSQSCEDVTENRSKLSKKQKKKRRRRQDAGEVQVEENTDAKEAEAQSAGTPTTVENNIDSALAEGSEVSGGNETVESVQPKQPSASFPKKKPPKTQGATQTSALEGPFLCNTCGQEFPTRNKMFTHLKATNHALRVEFGAEPSYKQDASSKKKKKGKRG